MPLKLSPTGEVIGVEAQTVAEAKLCIKELKLKKKELALEKKEVAAKIADVRAAHRSANVRRGPTVRGSSTFAKTMRTFDRVNKHLANVNTDSRVSSLEFDKAKIEKDVAWIENAIIQLERMILEES